MQDADKLRGDQAASVDLSSVITQVTTRDPIPAPAYKPPLAAPGVSTFSVEPSQQEPWHARLRFLLLCCFAPDNQGYVRSKDPYNPHHQGGLSQGSRMLVLPPQPPYVARDRDPLLGPKHPQDMHKKTLVLDLDETLVHSSFKPIPSPDYVIPVEIEGKLVDVYVLKRPWMDHFMESVGNRYEVVVFTASLSKYADPLLDLLDTAKVVRWRLFREACLPYEGNYVKDLTWLGRDLADTIIVDNSPHSYVFQPANALPISTFIDCMDDQELLELLPVLQATEFAEDVRVVLQQSVHHGDA